MNLEMLKFETNGSIATVTIAREKSLNALNSQVISELGLVFDQINSDTEIRSVILTGEGEKAFVAGADIKEMKDHGADEALAMSKLGQNVFSKIEKCRKPVIAAVNGFALGGGFELALACDFILASENAKFGLPEVSLGLIPGYGGTQRLARNIGAQKAKRLIFSGEMLDANTAYQWGIVTEVLPPEELIAKANKLATKISRQAPLAIQNAKDSVSIGYDKTLDAGLEFESTLFSKVFTTDDKNEGVTAFIEKRKPDFKGQ